MTHEIEVKVKVENVAGEIVFFVSDMPRVESSVRRNLANFDNWLYAKWNESGVLHCIESKAFQSVFSQQKEAHLDALGSLALSQDLEHDTIMIALSIAGYKPHSMTQFERAAALLDVAHELAESRLSGKSAAIWERLYTKTWEQTMKG